MNNKLSIFLRVMVVVITFGLGMVTAHFFGLTPVQLPQLTVKPWFDIPPEVKAKTKNRSVTVTAGGSQCSGCLIRKGYVLTALHCLGDLNANPAIAVNDERARLISDPIRNQELDLAVLSTFAEIDKRHAELDNYNSFGDNHDIIIVGSPGGFSTLVQPGKILSDAVDENTKRVLTDKKIISAQYVDSGISGGCIYSRDGETLLGIVTRKYEANSSLGQATFVSKPIE